MYDDYDDEVDQISDNALVNFYYNNKILVWIFIGIILFIILMCLLTRGGSNKESEIIYDIKISPESDVYVNIGRSTKLTAKVTNDPQAEIIWSISNSDVAKVDNGNVTGLDYGEAIVTATYFDSKNNRYYDTKKVIVAEGDANVSLADVSFREGDLFMPLNDTYKIALILSPSNGYVMNETFTSSNPSVATVDNKGLVNAVGEGKTVISFNVNNGQFRKELNVYVDRSITKKEIIITPDKIDLDGELRKIKLGETEKLTYTVKPLNTEIDKLIWKSSDENVVVVENGTIKGISEGRAIVTVLGLNGEFDRIDVEVEKDIIAVTDIMIDQSSIDLKVGKSVTIKPIISPSDASNKVLNYTSTDSDIAFVTPNETGTKATITGLKEGSTTIIIKSTNNIIKKLKVRVTDPEDYVKPTPTSKPTPTPTPYYPSGNSGSSSSQTNVYPTVTPRPTVSIKCDTSVKVGDYIDCTASGLVSGDSVKEWEICNTTFSSSGLTKTVRATKAGTCTAKVYTYRNATAQTTIKISSVPTPAPTAKPTVSIKCDTPVKVGDYINCTASNLTSGDSVKEWVICNTTFTASGTTKKVKATKAGTCTAKVYTYRNATAQTTIKISSAPTPAPTAKPTVSIKCDTPVKVGDYINCTASNLTSGDSVKEWVICSTTFTASGTTKRVKATKAGTCTAKVYTNRNATAQTTITINSAPTTISSTETTKPMSDLTFICNMGELTIKDGTTVLNWRDYCIREDKSSANYERFYYICSGKGKYTGEYRKTCSM